MMRRSAALALTLRAKFMVLGTLHSIGRVNPSFSVCPGQGLALDARNGDAQRMRDWLRLALIWRHSNSKGDGRGFQ
ncbi:hypothetical protein AT984_21075 [Paucibacter sp. KCTC 42545]|nr:hypothetical protein AT984_21075 [Paucibacter sp. KCTC 42545]